MPLESDILLEPDAASRTHLAEASLFLLHRASRRCQAAWCQRPASTPATERKEPRENSQTSVKSHPVSRATFAVHSTPPVVRWGGQENPSSIGIRRPLSGVLVGCCSPVRGGCPCCGFRWISGLDFRGRKRRGGSTSFLGGKMIDGLPNSTPTLMKLRTETNPLNDSFHSLARRNLFFSKGSVIPISEI